MKHLILLFFFLCSTLVTHANNITISNVSITGQNNAQKYKLVQFDITWDNAWRVDYGPNNWDAAWVFVKYRRKSDNTWGHATLHYVDGTGSGDGHTEPANCNISSSNDTGSGGAHGVFIHRTDLGQGTVTYTGARLRWNYGDDGLGDGDNVELAVMGIEMVYVPQGSFYVGSGGTEIGAFYTHPTTTIPYQITSEAAITVGTATGNLYYPNSLGSGGDRDGPIPPAFPKGYNATYCMKYEITQSQYVAFLNRLTYAQQVTRTAVLPTSAAGTAAMTTGTLYRNGIDIMTPGVASTIPAVYACNLDNDGTYDEANDGQSIACNWLSWADVAAYLDWSALRPMTELEFEKFGRGNQNVVADEYVWGSTTITGATSITNPGFNTEIAQLGANCANNGGSGGVQGPMRSGNFAQVATTRAQSGASYYGNMELSGNLFERPVTVGNATGRLFTGTKGNGVLDGTGNANVSTWPGINAIGVGFRGGAWNIFIIHLRLSDRSYAAETIDIRLDGLGGRGGRLAP